jgi:hypothetical protein
MLADNEDTEHLPSTQAGTRNFVPGDKIRIGFSRLKAVPFPHTGVCTSLAKLS